MSESDRVYISGGFTTAFLAGRLISVSAGTREVADEKIARGGENGRSEFMKFHVIAFPMALQNELFGHRNRKRSPAPQSCLSGEWGYYSSSLIKDVIHVV